MIRTLPGELSEKDAKGHTQFKCFLCEEVVGIFSTDFYSGKYCVCHRCMLNIVDQACKNKDVHKD